MPIKEMENLLTILIVITAIMKVSTTSLNLQETKKQCMGKHEMPIQNLFDFDILGDINEPLNLENFDKAPIETILENNSKTILLTMKYNASVAPTINFGPSSGLGTYRFQSLYFQWCHKSSTLCPIELHAVFYNTKLKHFDNALQRKNNIVVFAYGLEIGYSAETHYEVLQKSVKNVQTGNTKVNIENLPLKSWIPDDVDDFILYEGTLPFFNCDTQVLWVDFVGSLKIGSELLNEFKSLQTYEGAALMEQYKPFLAPTGPLVTHFGDYGNKDGTFGGIPFVDAYSDEDDIDWAYSGSYQSLKLLKQLGVFVVFLEIYLMF